MRGRTHGLPYSPSVRACDHRRRRHSSPPVTGETIETFVGDVTVDPCLIEVDGDEGNPDPFDGTASVDCFGNIQSFGIGGQECGAVGNPHANCSFNCPFEGMYVHVEANGPGSLDAEAICREEAHAKCTGENACQNNACCTQSDAIGACRATNHDTFGSSVQVRCWSAEVSDSPAELARGSSVENELAFAMAQLDAGAMGSYALIEFSESHRFAFLCTSVGCAAIEPTCARTRGMLTCAI